MAETYYYCSGTTKQSVSVDLSAGTCSLYQTYDDGYYIYRIYRGLITITLSIAIPVDLIVRYSYLYTYTTEGGEVQYTVTTTATVPAGIKTHSFYDTCKQERWDSEGGGGGTPL
jgi:hypothetical protein